MVYRQPYNIMKKYNLFDKVEFIEKKTGEKKIGCIVGFTTEEKNGCIIDKESGTCVEPNEHAYLLLIGELSLQESRFEEFMESEISIPNQNLSFGQALIFLQQGYNIARNEWGGDCFIVKQINSDIAANIVPKMQSLPDAAKREISKYADGSIHYREQCLLVYPDKEFGCMATNYVPDWQDMFANDWMIVE